MPASGEKTYDWSGNNQNPYVHPDISYTNRQAKIENGALRDIGGAGGPAKVYYNGALDRSKDLVSRVTLLVGTIYNDPVGPTMVTPDGEGYWMRVNGPDIALYKMTGNPGYGSNLYNKSATLNDGDEVEFRYSPAGLITCKINGATQWTRTQTDYLADVAPGAVTARENQGAQGMTSFGVEGIAASVAPPSWNGVPDPPPATEGVFYEYEFGHLIDGDGPFTIENIGDYGPSGWAIVDTHFGGIATNNGDFPNINLRAHNESGIPADSGPFVITVNVPVEPPSWLGDPIPPNGTLGVPYNYSFANLLAGDGPFVVSSIGTPLPSWASIVNNAIVGTPDKAEHVENLQFSALGQAPPNAETGLFSLLVNAGATPGPEISGVNDDDKIVSEVAGVIKGAKLTDTYSVRLNNHPIAFSVTSDVEVAYDAVDIHNTPLPPGLTVVELETSYGIAAFDVILEVRPGSTYVVATSIDTDPEHPGLLHATTEQAEVGDIYEGWIEQAALNVPFVYRAAGPHRSNIPPMPDDTITIGWFYDVSLQAWEHIREITRQSATAAPVISNPRHDVPVTHDEIVCYFDTTSATGTGYALATLTADEPSIEDIVNGNGEAADSRPSDVQAGEGPFVLDGLEGYTRYYYWFVQDSDNTGNYSNIVGGTALTASVPVGPPEEGTLTDPYHGAVGPDFGNVGCTSNTGKGLIYYVARLSSDQPSPEEIHFGIGASAHVYAPAVEGINGPIQLRGLDPTQLYYYWMVQDVNADTGEFE